MAHEFQGASDGMNWHLNISAEEVTDNEWGVSVWIEEAGVVGDQVVEGEAIAFTDPKQARLIANALNDVAKICDEKNKKNKKADTEGDLVGAIDDSDSSKP